MFNRLVQEGSFANAGAIPLFLGRLKSLFQLNTIPQDTLHLLETCKNHEFLQFHKHHIDDIHDSDGKTPMVSLCQSMFQVRKYNYTFIFPLSYCFSNNLLDSF